MTTPYRNEVDALQERKAALEAESKRLADQRAQLDWMAARETEIAKELSGIDAKLNGQGKRRLPTLDQVGVASPCSADWNEMLGDEEVRFCVSCEKNVYNVSALPKPEAEAFIAQHAAANADVCIRFYQRADGTIMTADCPVGATKKRRKKLAFAVAGAGALAFGAVTSLVRERGHHNMGAMQPISVQPVVEPTPVAPPVSPDKTPVIAGPDQGRHLAGKMIMRPRPDLDAHPVTVVPVTPKLTQKKK